ncbi:hypothetical protein Tco_1350444, partial [Tanacetum coccineum]
PSLLPSPLSSLSSPRPRILSPPLLLPPPHTSPTYASAPLGYRVAMVPLRAASPLHVPYPPLPVPSPPLLLPSADHRSDIPETGHTLARRVDYGFIDTLDARFRAAEGRVMTAVEEVDERVTDLAATQRQDAHELYRRYFLSMASSYEREAVYARQTWSHSEDRSQALEAHIRTLEAQVRTLQTQHDRMEWQRQKA